MFSSRSLLQNIGIIEKVSVSCKSTTNGKINLMKSLNAENKYLYGSLLETQKQRRKTINKVIESTELEPPSIKHSVIQDSPGVPVKNEPKGTMKITSKQRKKLLNSSQSVPMVSVDPSQITPSDCNSVNNNSDVISSSSVVNTTCNLEELKKKTKRLKTVKNYNVAVAGKNVISDSETTASSNEFVFKSSVSIDETNYPLGNVEKQIAQNSPVENVLTYSFTDPVIKDYAKFPSVSKIMEETMPDKNRIILSKWRQNMIRDLGEDGFRKHFEGLKTRGQEFHLAVRNAVLGKQTENCSEVTQNALKSLSWMLEHTSNPLAVESIAAHPKLGYKGIPDCVASFRNVPVVMDWKLSDKPKKDLKDTYEAPVQITAYIGALNHDPNYKWGISHGLVAVAYANGDPCDVFLLAPKHCQIYWRHWLMRFDKFKARNHLHTDHEIDEKSLELI